MLQQTQVATVIPYYQRYLESFPSIAALAGADPQDLMSHWEGLGYYRRARSLHAAAKKIVAEHNGQFPQSYEEVLALPGIGRYTAGAILSIACGQRKPIVEGNTQRLFSRWVAMRDISPQQPAARTLLWNIAEAMLPRKDPGTFNQAAMELGALVCTPRRPDCQHCPVATCCESLAAGIQEQIPGKVKQIQYEDRKEFALVVSDRASSDRSEEDRGSPPRYLLREIPHGQRWAGLWDFPRTTREKVDSVQQAAKTLSQQIGITMVPDRCLMTLRHAVTKYRIELHVHAAYARESLDSESGWRFLTAREMQELPMSVTGRHIADRLQNETAILQDYESVSYT